MGLSEPGVRSHFPALLAEAPHQSCVVEIGEMRHLAFCAFDLTSESCLFRVAHGELEVPAPVSGLRENYDLLASFLTLGYTVGIGFGPTKIGGSCASIALIRCLSSRSSPGFLSAGRTFRACSAYSRRRYGSGSLSPWQPGLSRRGSWPESLEVIFESSAMFLGLRHGLWATCSVEERAEASLQRFSAGLKSVEPTRCPTRARHRGRAVPTR